MEEQKKVYSTSTEVFNGSCLQQDSLSSTRNKSVSGTSMGSYTKRL
jgi:hypothetical protein